MEVCTDRGESRKTRLPFGFWPRRQPGAVLRRMGGIGERSPLTRRSASVPVLQPRLGGGEGADPTGGEPSRRGVSDVQGVTSEGT